MTLTQSISQRKQEQIFLRTNKLKQKTDFAIGVRPVVTHHDASDGGWR